MTAPAATAPALTTGRAPLRVGALFAGYGGLEIGTASALATLGHTTTLRWYAEIEDAPAHVVAHHHPGVPNLGDVTRVDWHALARRAPIDVLTLGFPCQDVSHAGKRLGLTPGTRSGLWSHAALAVGVLRPSLVVIENVRGLLSARAADNPTAGDVEPCPGCVGDPDEPRLRALGAVLGDLADLGYDASWRSLRAATVGAPHGRARVFVLAWPRA